MKSLALSVGLVVMVLINIQYSAAQDTVPAPEIQNASTRTLAAVKTWLSEAYATTETFRIAQAEHFTALRDQLKTTLKIDTPASSQIDIDLGIGGTDIQPKKEIPPLDNPLDYAQYILFISLASLFSHHLIFYVTSVLLAFLIFRFIISRFV